MYDNIRMGQSAHNCVLIKELNDDRGWGLLDVLRVTKESQLVDNKNLVPCGTYGFPHNTRACTLATECQYSIGVCRVCVCVCVYVCVCVCVCATIGMDYYNLPKWLQLQLLLIVV